jgi:predicted DsbA family dithiol-disulfide isomerase
VRAVHVTYYTDPASPACWAVEPVLRRLLARFGDRVAISYVMGGLARAIADPLSMMRDVLGAAAESAMPVDPRLWLEHPPRSTYPSCLGVKAAAEQGLEVAFLRRAREGFMCERRTLCQSPVLVDLARTVPGLDVARFAIDLESDAIVERFSADLDRTRAHARELPFAEVDGAGGLHAVGELEAAVLLAGAAPGGPPPGVEDALRRFGRMAVPEVAAVCELPGPQAAAELWRLAGEWRVRPQPVLTGELWEAAA